MANTMKAAVVRRIQATARDRGGSGAGSRVPDRSSSSSRPAASAIRTCTQPRATGRSSPSRRSSQATRAWVMSLPSAPASDSVKEGDRVGVPWLYTACGHCRYCMSGWETLCESQQNTGYSVNGGFAEYVMADPDFVGHLPAEHLVCRHRADPLRRRHRLQRPEVDRNAARRLGGRVRNRRVRPHGRSVREGHGT